MRLLPAYEALTSEHYAAGVHRADFRADPASARETINDWVEERTRDRIQDLLTEDDVTRDTRLVLTNAIYMKADWASPFTARATQRGEFRALSGQPVQVDMMHQLDRFRHIETSGFQAISMPYRGNELSMVIFLPERDNGILSFERRLSEGRLLRWLAELDEAEPIRVNLQLPKFRLEQRFQLGGALQALGMERAFSDLAQFPGFSADLSGVEAVKIGRVIHQTFLEVDEQGTEAAAATAVIMNVIVSATRYRNPPIDFHADHPFFFLIRDNRSGQIVFMGRLVAPEAAADEPEDAEAE